MGSRQENVIRNRPLALFFSLLMLGSSVAAAAADSGVPAKLQVAILLKVLVYDRTLAARAKDGLKLGVVYDPKSDGSKQAKDAFVQSFNETPHQVAGTTIDLVEVPQDSLEAEAKKNLDIAVVVDGANVGHAVETARRYNLVTFAPDQDAVENGVVIGLVPKDGKPHLLINVGASLSAGMQLDPQILRLADLVRGDQASK
jgi:hypothetical protein